MYTHLQMKYRSDKKRRQQLRRTHKTENSGHHIQPKNSKKSKKQIKFFSQKYKETSKGGKEQTQSASNFGVYSIQDGKRQMVVENMIKQNLKKNSEKKKKIREKERLREQHRMVRSLEIQQLNDKIRKLNLKNSRKRKKREHITPTNFLKLSKEKNLHLDRSLFNNASNIQKPATKTQRRREMGLEFLNSLETERIKQIVLQNQEKLRKNLSIDSLHALESNQRRREVASASSKEFKKVIRRKFRSPPGLSRPDRRKDLGKKTIGHHKNMDRPRRDYNTSHSKGSNGFISTSYNKGHSSKNIGLDFSPSLEFDGQLSTTDIAYYNTNLNQLYSEYKNFFKSKKNDQLSKLMKKEAAGAGTGKRKRKRKNKRHANYSKLRQTYSKLGKDLMSIQDANNASKTSKKERKAIRQVRSDGFDYGKMEFSGEVDGGVADRKRRRKSRGDTVDSQEEVRYEDLEAQKLEELYDYQQQQLKQKERNSHKKRNKRSPKEFSSSSEDQDEHPSHTENLNPGYNLYQQDQGEEESINFHKQKQQQGNQKNKQAYNSNELEENQVYNNPNEMGPSSEQQRELNRRLQAILEEEAAIYIQKIVKGWLCRIRYQEFLQYLNSSEAEIDFVTDHNQEIYLKDNQSDYSDQDHERPASMNSQGSGVERPNQQSNKLHNIQQQNFSAVNGKSRTDDDDCSVIIDRSHKKSKRREVQNENGHSTSKNQQQQEKSEQENSNFRAKLEFKDEGVQTSFKAEDIPSKSNNHPIMKSPSLSKKNERSKIKGNIGLPFQNQEDTDPESETKNRNPKVQQLEILAHQEYLKWSRMRNMIQSIENRLGQKAAQEVRTLFRQMEDYAETSKKNLKDTFLNSEICTSGQTASGGLVGDFSQNRRGPSSASLEKDDSQSNLLPYQAKVVAQHPQKQIQKQQRSEVSQDGDNNALLMEAGKVPKINFMNLNHSNKMSDNYPRTQHNASNESNAMEMRGSPSYGTSEKEKQSRGRGPRTGENTQNVSTLINDITTTCSILCLRSLTYRLGLQ